MGTVIQFKAKHQKPTYWSPLHPLDYLYEGAEGTMVGTAFLHQDLQDIGVWNVNYLFKAGLGQAPEQDVYKGNFMHPEVFMMSAIKSLQIEGKKLTEWAEQISCDAFVRLCLDNSHKFGEMRDHAGKPVWHKETPSLQALFERMQQRAIAGRKRTT